MSAVPIVPLQPVQPMCGAAPGALPPPCLHCGLRAREAFTSLPPPVLAFIHQFRAGGEAVEAGQVLVHEGQRSPRLFTLYAGWAFRYQTLPDGRRQILHILLPGDFVGLQQEFEGPARYGVEALTDGALCVFPGERLWELFRAHPRLGYDLTWLAAHEERQLDGNLLTVGRRSAAERVGALLLHLHGRLLRLGLVAADGSVAFPLTQQQLADALGLSLVHTNKTLRRLAREGLLHWQAGRLRLPQPEALARLAQYHEPPPRALPLL